jgi:glycosyltransferase involved in cell wall biosynthesis
MLELSVVVTNFQRPEKLNRCLDSLVNAGVLRVVVSTTAPTSEVFEVIQKFKSRFREFQIVSTKDDLGCNENWLRGVYYARTPYVLILHDDDFLMPRFGEVFKRTMLPQLNRGVGFASWRGKSVTDEGVERDENYFSGPTTVHASGAVSKLLLEPGRLTISPVLSVFRRTDCIRILKESSVSLTHPDCFTRPTMMVGNDLLLYLRHAEKYSSWLYVDEVLTCFGKWSDSETVKAFRKKKNPLVVAYDFARDVFKKTRGPAVKLPRRLIHVYSDYAAKDPGAIRRHNYALKTWEHQYEVEGNMIPLPLQDENFARSSKDLGDSKAAPFVKDIIEAGMLVAAPGDRVVMTNRDTCLVRDTTERLLKTDLDAVYAVRQDFFNPISETAAVMKNISHGHLHCGADLVSISPEWWSKWKSWIPDLVLSYEAWDLMVREIFAETQPGQNPQMTEMVYHEYHETFWGDPANRYTHPVQIYCLRAAKNFYHSRGLDQHYSLKK